MTSRFGCSGQSWRTGCRHEEIRERKWRRTKVRENWHGLTGGDPTKQLAKKGQYRNDGEWCGGSNQSGWSRGHIGRVAGGESCWAIKLMGRTGMASQLQAKKRHETIEGQRRQEQEHANERSASRRRERDLSRGAKGRRVWSEHARAWEGGNGRAGKRRIGSGRGGKAEPRTGVA